jgi:Lrp/AsnC family leucine-responsive transcriptional regulator
MPLQLDDYGVSILRSLVKDGRKSFREISRETGITTPTVKARFTRLVNVGFIKSVSPIFDYSIVGNDNILKPEFDKQQDGIEKSQVKERQGQRDSNNKSLYLQENNKLIKKGLWIKLDCELCKGSYLGWSTRLQICNL